jgi:hypothetical protein
MNAQQYRQFLAQASKEAQQPKIVDLPAPAPDISFHRMFMENALRHTKALHHFKDAPVHKQEQVMAMLRADLQCAREWLSEATTWATRRGGEAGSNLILVLRENRALVDALAAELDAATPEHVGMMADHWQGVFLTLKSALERTRLLTYRPLPRKQ